MKAPDINTGFRPTLSTQMTAGIVAKNMLKTWSIGEFDGPEKLHYAIPTTPVARREMAFPVKPRFWKILGA